jgi:hypothetical protein
MAEKEEIYPKGYPKQTESFSDNQKFKYDVYEAIKEVSLESTKKAFEDKGYTQKEGAAGEYGTGEKYGKGTELHHFNIRLSSRPNTNTYFEKIIYFGGKEYIIEVAIGWDAKNKTIELSYKTPEGAAFRGYGSEEGPHMVDGKFNFVIKSVSEFKKDLKIKFDEFAQKEVAQITKTKMGIEDKTEKSINSMVEHMKNNKFTLSSLYNSSFDEVSDIVGNYINEAKKDKEKKKDNDDKLRMNSPEVVAANSKGKMLFDFETLEEAEKQHGTDYKEYFKKQMEKYGVESPGDLAKSQWTAINAGWTSKKEKGQMDEITSGGSAAVGAIGGQVVDGELGTAGAFKYAANPFEMDKGTIERKFNNTNYSKKDKKRSLKKEYNANSSAPYSYTVDINPGSGYVPKGMEKNYVAGQHGLNESVEKVNDKLGDSKLLKESMVKRKFTSDEEGVNKRYIVTEKRNVDEEKDRWKKLSLFETYETIHKAEGMCECMNECTCGSSDSYEDDNLVTMDQGQEENERDFIQRNQDAESGEFVDGKEVIIVAKPKSMTNVMYKVFKDDFMNENKAYILDLSTGNLVNNPSFKIGR